MEYESNNNKVTLSEYYKTVLILSSIVIAHKDCGVLLASDFMKDGNDTSR